MNGAAEEEDDSAARFWDEKVGPFFDAEGLFKWFGYSQEFLDEHVQAREVLSVLAGDGFEMFPSFQFDPAGGLLPHLADMLEAIDPLSKDPWGDALWLNSADEDLGGMTPAQALRTELADVALVIGGQAGAHWLP